MTSLQERIHLRLESALTRQERASFETFGGRGLATDGPDGPVIRLSMNDVARIAAQAVEER
ncbi:hypothetical protein ACPCHT_32135 [Nucisporomicrobium flavum]|uniref:hypothetical protein n=1 Tax=Nucisporomicrobium flavum TaxID=2785915 RepID=UPI003C2C1FC6